MSICQTVSLGNTAVTFYDLDYVCQSVFGKKKKNVCSLSSPPLSQHVGLCVCEDSSCILRSRSRGKHLPLSPSSPSSSSSCPHLTLMAVGFLMRKWVSLCGMSAEASQKGEGGRFVGEGEEMYWCKTHPPAVKLKRQPSRVGQRGALSQ